MIEILFMFGFLIVIGYVAFEYKPEWFNYLCEKLRRK
tara:strand:- start:742 stop:852 length:111 start_codon:yes stop_codon:yes gene_type:complete